MDIAFEPNSSAGWEIVVNGGSQYSAKLILSKPAIEISSGIFRPINLACLIAPIAISSFMQKMAVGGAFYFISIRVADMPERKE